MFNLKNACGAIVCLCAIATALAADSQPQSGNRSASAPTAGALPADYLIGVDDILNVIFWKEKDLSAEGVVVRPDGKISLPMLNDITGGRHTPEQLGRAIAESRDEVTCEIRRDRDRAGDAQPQGLRHRRSHQTGHVSTGKRDERAASSSPKLAGSSSTPTKVTS